MSESERSHDPAPAPDVPSPDAAEPAPPATDEPALEVPPPVAPVRALRLGPDKIVLLPVVVAFLGGIPAAFSSPALTWILLLPVLAGAWVVRARVVVKVDGLEVCNGLGVHRVDWPQVGGFDVPRRGFVRLRVLPGAGRDRLPLTAMPRRDLPRLLDAATPNG